MKLGLKLKGYLLFLVGHFIRLAFLISVELVLILVVFFKSILIRYSIKKSKSNLPRLFWGTTPIISHKYFSNAMIKDGFESKTIMEGVLHVINNKEDYDEYVYDKLPFSGHGISKIFNRLYSCSYRPYVVYLSCLSRFDIFHFTFNGGLLSKTILRRLESQLLHLARKKIVILGYGGDFYRYSKVLNKSWTHTLLAHYPNEGINEHVVSYQVNYWIRHADCVINGMQIDGIGRWDVLPFRTECIDIDNWKPKKKYSSADGKNDSVNIVHAPNHRFIKGTEYLVDSVETLKNEGLSINLILLERLQNFEVKRILEKSADIFFDQLILGYAMSTIEAFALGLPVLTNLENEDYTRVFRRYSYLNECPAMTVSHETLTDVLRILVTSPSLRSELGKAGRDYAVKYHSYKTAQVLFRKVYDKIWFHKKVDLINHFHPLLKESYNNSLPIIKHPLIENKSK